MRSTSRWTLLPTALHALLIAAIVEVGLRLVPLDRLALRMGVPLAADPGVADSNRSSLDPPVSVGSLIASRKSARAVDAAMRRWPFGDTCLRRSLVLGHLLRDEDPRLVLGVERREGRVRAHAWIETSAGHFYGDSGRVESETAGMGHDFVPLRRRATGR